MIRLASLMLLAWLILISGHMKFFELIVMNVCSCCLNSYHVQDLPLIMFVVFGYDHLMLHDVNTCHAIWDLLV